MRIWQNFRDPRTGAALISALLALIYGIIDLRALFADALSGVKEPDPVLASTLALGIVSLAGAVVTLRRGNLVFLLVAWAFVLGNRFAAIMAFLDEVTQTTRSNIVLAVVTANVDLIAALVGASLAFLATALRRTRARPATS
jgi:hypothetical protein